MPDLRLTRDEAAGLLARLRLLAAHQAALAEDRAEAAQERRGRR
jgi:hypothetical protein